MKSYFPLLLSCFLLSAGTRSSDYSRRQTDSIAATINAGSFHTLVDGKQVQLFTLKNKNGLTAAITNYGGRLVSLAVPDRMGKFRDVVLGYQELAGYRKRNDPFFGALIGRYGNRIAKGQFALDGTAYQLTLNNGANTLHGGPTGFHTRVWDAKPVGTQSLELTYISKDGEEGFPGNLTVKVIYTLTDDNSLKLEYSAATDKTTVINLTNHSYFNLSGAGSATITDHLLSIEADKYTPGDAALIPTGELKDVAGTPFDFRQPVAMAKNIDSEDPQVKMARGYDHNFVLRKKGNNLALAATVTSPASGIVMKVLTTEPGLQFYSGNGLDGRARDGKGGMSYARRSAFCLETQHFPDSPNHPGFPSTVLNPDQVYRSTTLYTFEKLKAK